MNLSPCAACGSSESRLLLHGYSFDNPVAPFDVIECKGCRLVRVSPFPGPEELARYYAMSYYGGSSEEKFSKPIEFLVKLTNHWRARPVIRLLENRDPDSTRILDVGCGRGSFLKYLHRQGYACFGTEIPSFPLPSSQSGLSFIHGTIENLPFDPEYFDAVSIWHVLEHTANPASTLKKISAILKPGGVAAVAVPNFGSIQARVFGPHWFHLDLPRHLYHFNRLVLCKMLRESGLEPLSVHTHSLDQNLYGFIQSTLNVLFPKKPNWLYAFLQGGHAQVGTLSRFAWAVMQLSLAALLFPLSVLANFISVLLGRGATLIIYARKS